MRELQVATNLPLGIAWSWVKDSFAIFRDKPINFLFLAIIFVIFSFFPFIGAFISVFVLVRIYLCADKTAHGQNFGLRLNLGELLSRRNIINYALLNAMFDLLSMLIVEGLINYWGIETSNQMAMVDKRIMLVLIFISLLRVAFFGISLALVTFHEELGLFKALQLNWRFMLRYWTVLGFALFLLLPFLLLPLYLGIILVFSINITAITIMGMLVILLAILIFIVVSTIFAYKLYADGFSFN